MRIDDQFVAMANDYISGNLKPEDLRGFIEENVDESLELDKSGDPKALLFGFIQVRLYEMDDGLPEHELRTDVEQYLREHGLLRPAAERRATG